MKTKYKEYSEERKRQQELGTLPIWFTTAGFQLITDKHYVDKNETVLDRFKTIASTLSKHLPEKLQDEYEIKFFDLLWNGHLGAATPVFTNTGKPSKGMPISCSGQFCADTVDSFYKTAHEVAMLSKNGFGTSVYLGDIRPRGSLISNGSKSDGVVPVLELIFNTAKHISQGSSRRGSVACYLPINHGDFHEVCHWLENNPEGSNFGWCFYKEDIDKLNNNDPELLARYQEVLYLRMLGIGYIFNHHNANIHSPDVYKSNNINVLASNLCLSEDTLIELSYNENGEDSFKESILDAYTKLTLKEYNVDNLYIKSFNEITDKFFFTKFEDIIYKGDANELVEINYDNEVLSCTKDHLILTTNGYVTADELTKDSKIISTTEIDFFEKKLIKTNKRIFDLLNVGEFNNFVANGIVVHNCSEIFLASSEKYTFTCCLSSLNLVHFDKMLENSSIIFDSIVFLDCVNSEFIKQSEGIPGLEKAREFATWSRPIGLGVMGLSTYFQSKSIVFDSFEGYTANTQIFKYIKEIADNANRWLAEIQGEPELMKGTGLRCSHVLSIPPTLSNAVISGGVSNGIEPFFANVFTQESAAGEMRRANPILVNLLKEKNKWNKNTIDSIIKNKGSVQHLDFLTEHEKNVFKTAFEVDQFSIIRMADTRQRYIDQGQSLNLFIPSEADEEYVSKLHKEALTAKYIKSLYYIRSTAGVFARTTLSEDTTECASCGG